MATASDGVDDTPSPDDAFAILGNENRMAILQELAEAHNPLAFSELRDRVGVSDSGQFNYHLDKLAGHFVESTDEGYDLRRPGKRVIEAVVSGAVTESPVIDPTQIDEPCGVCGATSITMCYLQERIVFSCAECQGIFDGSEADIPIPEQQLDEGYLGSLALPPAGIKGRTPEEIFLAANTWNFLETIAQSRGICPRCSAAMDRTVEVCETHDASDGPCEACGSLDDIKYRASCPNCHFTVAGGLLLAIHGNREFLDLLTSSGFNPVDPTGLTAEEAEKISEGREVQVISTDPVQARITLTFDERYLSLVLDEELNVLEVDRSPESTPD